MMDREMSWFKRGVQFDARCNGLNANGEKAKPAVTVFAEDRADAVDLAVKELAKYGYTGLTVDHIVRVG